MVLRCGHEPHVKKFHYCWMVLWDRISGKHPHHFTWKMPPINVCFPLRMHMFVSLCVFSSVFGLLSSSYLKFVLSNSVNEWSILNVMLRLHEIINGFFHIPWMNQNTWLNFSQQPIIVLTAIEHLSHWFARHSLAFQSDVGLRNERRDENHIPRDWIRVQSETDYTIIGSKTERKIQYSNLKNIYVFACCSSQNVIHLGRYRRFFSQPHLINKVPKHEWTNE